MKKFQHPVHDLWPLTKVCRYLHFYQLFDKQWNQLFSQNEQLDGTYHGQDYDDAVLVAPPAPAPREGGESVTEEETEDYEFI